MTQPLHSTDNTPQPEAKLVPIPGSVSFTLNAFEVKRDFRALFDVINTLAFIDQIENIKIERVNNVIKLTGTDISNVVTFTIPQEPGKDFSICVDAGQLRSFLYSEFENPVITFVVEKDKLVMKSGDLSLCIPCRDTVKYPSPLTKIEGESKFTIDSKELFPVLQRALIFISNDYLRPGMTGVHLTDYKDHLYAVSTDAHKLFWCPIIKTPKAMKGVSFTINNSTIKLVLSAFKSEPVEIQFDKDAIFFTGINKQVRGRLIDSGFPKWEHVLVSHELFFYVNRKKMIRFLRIAEVFSNKSTRELFMKVSGKKMQFWSGDDNFNFDLKYSIPIVSPSKSFDDFTFALNGSMLRQVVTTSPDEYIKIEHSTIKTSAIIIDDRILLMPLMPDDSYENKFD